MRSGEDPLSADKSASTQVLIKGVDERDLPAPLGRVSVLAPDYPPAAPPVRPLHAAHVFTVYGRARSHCRMAHHRNCWQTVNLILVGEGKGLEE